MAFYKSAKYRKKHYTEDNDKEMLIYNDLLSSLSLMRAMWEKMGEGLLLIEQLNRDLDLNLHKLTFPQVLPFFEKVINWTENEAIFAALFYSKEFIETQPLIVVTDYLGFFQKDSKIYFENLIKSARK